MKATRWLTDEQIEAIEAAHREEEDAIVTARIKRRAKVKTVLSTASAGDLVAKKPHLKSEKLFPLVSADGWSVRNGGDVGLTVEFGHTLSVVPLRDIFVKAKK